MSEVKRSPEEWSIKPFGTGLDIINQDGEDLAFVRVTSRGAELAQTRAHLIAAAPEMLVALKTCLAAETARLAKLKPGAPATTYTETRLAMVRAAIAKAEGRS